MWLLALATCDTVATQIWVCFARFDGCMCGLTTFVGGPEAAGMCDMAVKRPWKVACLRTSLPEMLNKRCDGSHAHAPCAGRITRGTQGYTREICDVIHSVCRNGSVCGICTALVCIACPKVYLVRQPKYWHTLVGLDCSTLYDVARE